MNILGGVDTSATDVNASKMLKYFDPATLLFHGLRPLAGSEILVLAIIIFACSAPTDAVEGDSTTITSQSKTVALVERRVALEEEMDEILNSIDHLIFRIADRKAKGRIEEYNILNDALYQLSLGREKIEEGKQKVDTTALADWNDQFVRQIHTTIQEVNVDIEKIRASAGMAE